LRLFPSLESGENRILDLSLQLSAWLDLRDVLEGPTAITHGATGHGDPYLALPVLQDAKVGYDEGITVAIGQFDAGVSEAMGFG
jgi:hypothetical protein